MTIDPSFVVVTEAEATVCEPLSDCGYERDRLCGFWPVYSGGHVSDVAIGNVMARDKALYLRKPIDATKKATAADKADIATNA